MPLTLPLRISFLAVAAFGFLAGWAAHRPPEGFSVNNPAAAGVAVAGDAAPLPPSAVSSPVASVAPGSARMPAAASALLKSLTPAGGLKDQAAILQYASALDLESARKLARSFEGTGYSSDRNTSALRDVVFTRWAELDAEGVIRDARTSAECMHNAL